MWNRLKDHFAFSKRERNGFTFAILIILGLIITYIVIDNYDVGPDHDLAQFDPELQEYLNSLDSVSQQELPDTTPTVELFEFDPNNLPREQWQQLGLSNEQIDMIYKYESKGGSFEIRSDLSKMYCIDSLQYSNLEPFILLPENVPPDEYPLYESVEIIPEKVNINIATAYQLTLLWGVGPNYSEKIITYREQLGGFHSAEQLLEIYGLDGEVLEKNTDLLVVSGDLTLLDINSLSAKELQQHPYLDWNAAGHIVQWREKNGQFSSVDEVLSNSLIVEEIYSKIAPYLTVGE